jgi:hypothetical protein
VAVPGAAAGTSPAPAGTCGAPSERGAVPRREATASDLGPFFADRVSAVSSLLCDDDAIGAASTFSFDGPPDARVIHQTRASTASPDATGDQPDGRAQPLHAVAAASSDAIIVSSSAPERHRLRLEQLHRLAVEPPGVDEALRVELLVCLTKASLGPAARSPAATIRSDKVSRSRSRSRIASTCSSPPSAPRGGVRRPLEPPGRW